MFKIKKDGERYHSEWKGVIYDSRGVIGICISSLIVGVLIGTLMSKMGI